jgi:hypothetical protein
MKYSLCSLLFLISTDCFAGAWSNWAMPTRLDVVRQDGIMVYGAFGNPAGCTVPNQFFLAYGTAQYSQIYATLLMAFSTGKQVQVYAGSCAPAPWYSVASTTYNTVTTYEAVNVQN